LSKYEGKGPLGGTTPRRDCNIIMDPTLLLLRGRKLDLFVSRCRRMRVIGTSYWSFGLYRRREFLGCWGMFSRRDLFCI